MRSLTEPIRRVITEINLDGKSYISEDALVRNVKVVPERPGYRVSNIWRTTESPALINAPDSVHEHIGVLPPKNGNVFRVIDYPPEPKDAAELKRQQDATFGALYPDAGHDLGPNDHPGMHITETVDYAVVLAGEMTAILETEETVLKTGDILIQRGTNHAWANRSGQAARILFILLDGKY
jgi:hypothetical protein